MSGEKYDISVAVTKPCNWMNEKPFRCQGMSHGVSKMGSHFDAMVCHMVHVFDPALKLDECEAISMLWYTYVMVPLP